MAVYVYNDLEPAAFDLRPDLERICERGLECGALVTVLSGSGPTVLGLARDADHARTIAHELRERGHDAVAVVHGPVAGAHVVRYE
ncbi:hypothetical protein MF408_05475 [Nocardioides sp. TF02-7]|nr:hypothetical protein MF408_05475 [Nocardioides sp. TF02-7]